MRPAASGPTSSAPLATRVALIATLATTALAVAEVLRRSPLGPRETGAFLFLFSALFLVRVAGQVLVVLRAPGWLPPMRQWHLMPYRLLLPTQFIFLAAMAAIVLGLFRGEGPLVDPRPALGRVLIGFSAVYAGAMVVRYAVRMTRRPGERWFGGAIPIVFHLVLAAFLFTWGWYHAQG